MPTAKDFTDLADLQRGAPESAMTDAQLALGGGVLSYAIEHVGDLTHRMNENAGRPGEPGGREKVEKVLRAMRHRYGFEKEHLENMESNARFHGEDPVEYKRKAYAALDRYADEHEKLPVYNRAQELARGAAIDLGRRRFGSAEKKLTELASHMDPDEEWERFCYEGLEGRRRNPPVSVAIKPVRVALRGHERQARALGADLDDVYGCGKFGCVYPGKNGYVVKVTTDKHEVRMVKEVIQLRRSRTRLATRYRRRVEALGCSVEKASMLPGIVAFKEPIVALGKKSWAYRREDVKPIDAIDTEKARRLKRKLRRAIDDFFYPTLFRPDPVNFLREFPELKAIVVTALYMEWAFGVRLEDLHEEQVGVVMKTTSLHPRGTLVLYDAQTD